MKITFYTSWKEQCGIADYSRHFKRALERIGISVEIVSFGRKKGAFDLIRYGKMMNTAGIAHIQFEYSFFSSSFPVISLIHCYLFSRNIGIPKVLTMHEIVPPKGFGGYPHLHLYRKIFSTVDLVMVHTEKHRETILDMGIDSNKVVIVPHPVPEVKLPGNKQHYKELLHVGGKHVLTIFGFIGKRKGYDLAMNAMRDMDDCVLLIAGGQHPNDTSAYVGNLEKKIREMKIENRAKMLGYLSESQITEVMGATDIILAPFLDMPGSGSLSLGVAYHKPIIGSDIEQMKELASRGMGIEFYQKNNAGSLRDKIIALTGDPRRCAELEQLSTSYAATYSYSNTAARLGEIYSILYKNWNRDKTTCLRA